MRHNSGRCEWRSIFWADILTRIQILSLKGFLQAVGLKCPGPNAECKNCFICTSLYTLFLLHYVLCSLYKEHVCTRVCPICCFTLCPWVQTKFPLWYNKMSELNWTEGSEKKVYLLAVSHSKTLLEEMLVPLSMNTTSVVPCWEHSQHILMHS